MATSEIAKIDSKGRIVIPQAFREMLGMKENQEVSVMLDGKNGRIIIGRPEEKKLLQLIIGISDKPGSLARIATELARQKVDLVSTESRSLSRGKNAEWKIACNASSVKNLKALKKKLMQSGATYVSVTS